MQEVVFFHPLSRTLIAADLLMYFDDRSPLMTKFWAKRLGIYGKPSASLDTDLSLAQKHQARQSVERILQWDFDKIILAHGSLITDNATQQFKEAFSWLLTQSIK